MKQQMKFSMKRKYIKRRRVCLLLLIIIISILIHLIGELILNLYSKYYKNEQVIDTIVVYNNPIYNEPIDNILIFKPNNMKESTFNIIYNICNQENVPIECILSIITVENELYNENEIYKNKDGSTDIGLCQINSKYINYFADKYNINNLNPLNVSDSVLFLTRHFKYLTECANNKGLYGLDSYMFAAGAYNRGLSNEIKYGNMYDYKEKFINSYNKFI